MGSQAKRWCFTINNYTEDEFRTICDSAPANTTYLVAGREVGESGTPHLQGFLILSTKLRLRQIKALAGFGRAHLEISRGTNEQAASYCKKEGNYFEHGSYETVQGKRSDFESFKEWVKEQQEPITHRDVAENFPSLWGRYRSSCLSFIDLFGRRPQLVDGDFRDWQQDLDDIINGGAHPREVIFVLDPAGNSGKSWLTRYWYTKRDDLQRLSIGKRDDLAYAIDTSKRLFVFDIPRGQIEMLQYCILEQLKDQMVFSPKYESLTKILPTCPHVVVFTNEEPDRSKMTADRYKIIYI